MVFSREWLPLIVNQRQRRAGQIQTAIKTVPGSQDSAPVSVYQGARAFFPDMNSALCALFQKGHPDLQHG